MTISAKYEHDIPYVPGIFMNLKNWEINGMEEIGFVTPTPDAKIGTFQDRLVASCE